MVISLSLDAESSNSSVKKALHGLSAAVAKSKRVVVVSGAGISCSSGIPVSYCSHPLKITLPIAFLQDFRSSDGLYNIVKSQYPDAVLKGRDLFDSSLFQDTTSTSIFYTFISKLKVLVDDAQPSPTHHFLKTLDSKGKLLRSYTQNIDGFEERVGLQSKAPGKRKDKNLRNVLLHGNIHEVRCNLCNATAQCNSSHLSSFLDGIAPDCDECSARCESAFRSPDFMLTTHAAQARVASSRRPLKVGTLRPAIVLYDEVHPEGETIGALQTKDLCKRPDLLIIMGTSLKVFGLKKLVKEFAKAVHDCPAKNGLGGGKVIFVNLTKPSGSEWDSIIDYHVEGTTDAWVLKVEKDWRKIRPSDWEVQTTLLQANAGLKLQKHGSEAVKGTSFDSVLNLCNCLPTHLETKPNKENIPPQTPPPSPSKRRSKHSHYEQPSSPSKKHDASGPLSQHHVKMVQQDSGDDPFLAEPASRQTSSAALAWMSRDPVPEHVLDIQAQPVLSV
jgi:NAD-dependent histone deacetylase SIR2